MWWVMNCRYTVFDDRASFVVIVMLCIMVIVIALIVPFWFVKCLSAMMADVKDVKVVSMKILREDLEYF
jgi:hypothetical protein